MADDQWPAYSPDPWQLQGLHDDFRSDSSRVSHGDSKNRFRVSEWDGHGKSLTGRVEKISSAVWTCSIFGFEQKFVGLNQALHEPEDRPSWRDLRSHEIRVRLSIGRLLILRLSCARFRPAIESIEMTWGEHIESGVAHECLMSEFPGTGAV